MTRAGGIAGTAGTGTGAGGRGAAAYLDAGGSTDKDRERIRKQLESSSDRENLDAMRLVGMISKNHNASPHFASVVKNVASLNLEIRKLVYIYLLKYASTVSFFSLLSINTFQRDPNPLIRAMTLRVLSGIGVGMVGGLVGVSIAKCVADMSPYVRKVAVLAVRKCYELNTSHLPALIQTLTTLLRDRSPLALGAVVFAFESVCPTQLDLLHPHFRRLSKILVEMDEWGQVVLMELLLRYARTMLARPIWREGAEVKESEGPIEMDKDLELLLESVKPVFQSRNPADE